MRKFTEILLEDFDYQLPPELIAYYPLPQRDQSRMLVLDRKSGSCEIRKFKEIPEFFQKGDCVVRNNSKVIKARIFASPLTAPEKKTEFLMVEPSDPTKKIWTVLTKPHRNLKKFKEFLAITPQNKKLPPLKIEVLTNSPETKIKFISEGENLQILLDEYGHIPLPPYIKRPDERLDTERYQTVYAKNDGSIASPTAGLHFTNEIFERISKKGVNIAELTLHVGIGTFRPIKTNNVSEHKIHSEYFSISESEAQKINFAKEKGNKIIAIGTTTIRALESALGDDAKIHPFSGKTNIFIYPPYEIKSADILFTNFHLPKSTLFLLVCAFAGKEKIMNAYNLAIKEKFRFYSYGDCMLIK
ncbi:MAG TPA: tRNA preQ1(34) S-adenosylmethionine ribosyltransferase-isomerase QueA [Victivallales bacterium]|nr:tRNA preQ1(34) S-adenosylmethionine ribosyltransferase-isomerase QueA [Victivallales bacterium]HRR06094.1 tRNA preQ1(34) S-adenosylmethionine ribosyltransferase-isomerase QueA [Victivallales bacterium]HRR28245.1 tRNA preQ1(34) S-adenosylmethionine ribosyltransferase-isomerase QueA [Victivallales bacterium]HRU01623.1 tRNA preQ1(34) S-adenosylmethionine ribosyltransferase-isomerase QueA [Victivallales bacterium]